MCFRRKGARGRIDVEYPSARGQKPVFLPFQTIVTETPTVCFLCVQSFSQSPSDKVTRVTCTTYTQAPGSVSITVGSWADVPTNTQSWDLQPPWDLGIWVGGLPS